MIIPPIPAVIPLSEMVVPRSVCLAVIGTLVRTATEIRIEILAVEGIFSTLPIVTASTSSISSSSPIVVINVMIVVLHESVAVQAAVAVPVIHWEWFKSHRSIHKDAIVLRRL